MRSLRYLPVLCLLLAGRAEARPGQLKLALKTRTDAIVSAITGKPRRFPAGRLAAVERSGDDGRAMSDEYRVGRWGGLEHEVHAERVRDGEGQTRFYKIEYARPESRSSYVVHSDGGRTTEVTEKGQTVTTRRDGMGRVLFQAVLDHKTGIRRTTQHGADGVKTITTTHVRTDESGLQVEDRLATWQTR